MSGKEVLETYKDQVDLNRDAYESGKPDKYEEVLRDALFTLASDTENILMKCLFEGEFEISVINSKLKAYFGIGRNHGS